MSIWVKRSETNQMYEISGFHMSNYTLYLFGNCTNKAMITIDYSTKEKCKIVYDELCRRIAKLELLKYCVEDFSADILNENSDDETPLDDILNLMVFLLPETDNPIIDIWEKNQKDLKENKKGNTKKITPKVNTRYDKIKSKHISKVAD